MHDHTELRAGDVGTVIEFTLCDESGELHDLTGTTVTGRFQRPDGTVFERELQLGADASEGIARYVFENGEIDQVGTWWFQPIVESGAGRWHGTVQRVRVHRNLREAVG